MPNPTNKTDDMAKKWLAYGIDRKICKKPVMCLPYSLTQYSCRQYIQDHVEKELKEKKFDDLVWRTPEGIDVKPLYTAEDINNIQHEFGITLG